MNKHTPRLQRLPIPAAIAASLAGASLLLPGLAFAGPTGGVVVGGSGTISTPSPTTTVINQTSNSAIINWQQFNIGGNEYVQFIQPSSSSVVLNRVIGGSPSTILGNLSANGRVFLINPNGVLFGAGATLDVGGLVASTLSIKDADFLSGRYVFSGGSAAGSSVTNAGTIKTADGGFVVLAGDYVKNTGVIQSRLGQVVLASGAATTLDIGNSGLISVKVDQATLASKAGVDNAGQIIADGGRVIMTAKTAHDLAGSAVNNTGLIRAQGIASHDGEIELTASGGDITDSGTLDVSSTSGAGGTVDISADRNIDIQKGAQILASGTSGGDVHIVAEGTLATHAGSLIDTRGSNGKGGLTELSGHGALTVRGDVLIGNGGTLLIDPTNIVIAGGSGSSTSAGGTATMYQAFLESELQKNAGSTIQLVASNSILVESLAADQPGNTNGYLNGINANQNGASLTLGIGSISGGVYMESGGGSITFQTLTDTIAVYGGLKIDAGKTSGMVNVGNLIGGDVTIRGLDGISAGSIHATHGGITLVSYDSSTGTGKGSIDVASLTSSANGSNLAESSAISVSAGGGVKIGSISSGASNGGSNGGSANASVSIDTNQADTGGAVSIGGITAGASSTLIGSANASVSIVNHSSGKAVDISLTGPITVGAMGNSSGDASLTISNDAGGIKGAAATLLSVASGFTRNDNVTVTAKGSSGNITLGAITGDSNYGGLGVLTLDASGSLSLTSGDLQAQSISVTAGAGTLTLGNLTTNSGSLSVVNTGGDITTAALKAIGGFNNPIANITVQSAGGINVKGGISAFAESGNTSNVEASIDLEANYNSSGNGSLTVSGPISTSASAVADPTATVTLHNYNGSIDLGTSSITTYASNGPFTGAAVDDSITLIANNGSVTAGNLSAQGPTANSSAPYTSNITVQSTGSGSGINIGTLSGGSNGGTLTAVDLESAGTLVTASTSISAGSITLAAGSGNLSFAGLTAGSFGSVKVTDTGGNIKIGALAGSSLSLIDFEASGTLSVPNSTVSAGSITLKAGAGNLSFGSLSVGNGGSVTVADTGGNVKLGALTGSSLSLIDLEASGTLSVPNGNVSAGNIKLAAGVGNLTFGTLTATPGGSITVTDTGGSIKLGNIAGSSLNTVDLEASGSLSTTSSNITASSIKLIAGAGALSFGTLTGTPDGSITVKNTGGNVSLGTVSGSSLAAVDLEASGSLTLANSNLNAFGITVSAGAGTLTLNSLTGGGSGVAVHNTGGDVALGTVNTSGGGKVDVTAKGSIDVNNNVNAAGALSFSAAGAVTTNGHGNTLAAGGVATVKGGSLALYKITGGSGVTLTATGGNASFTSATATTGAAMVSDTGGVINGTTLAASDSSGFVTVIGDQGISLGTVNAGYGMSITNKTSTVTLSTVSAGSGGVVVKNTGGDADLGLVNTTNGGVTVDSGGVINLNNSVTAGGLLSFSAAGAVTTNGHGNAISAGDSVKITGSSLSLYTVSAGSGASLIATKGDLGATSVTASSGNLFLTDTKGSINVGSVTATTGSIYVTGNAGNAADQGIILTAFSAADGLNITNHGGAVTLGGGSVRNIDITTLNAGGDVNFNGVTSTTGNGDIIVSASGAINVNNNVTAAGSLSFKAAGVVTTNGHGNALSAGDGATISGTSLSLYTVTGGNGVTLKATGGNASFTSATATAGNINLTDSGGMINGTTLTANGEGGFITVTGDKGISLVNVSAGYGMSITNKTSTVSLSNLSGGSGGVVVNNTGGDIELGAVNTSSHGGVTVDSGGTINLNNNVTASGALSFSAAGAVTTNGHGNTVGAGGNVKISGASLSLYTVSGGSGASLIATKGDLGATSVTATSGNLFLTDTKGSINVGSVTATAGSIYVTGNAGTASDQGITIGAFTGGSEGGLNITNHGGAVTLGGGTIRNINITTFNAGGDVNLNGAANTTGSGDIIVNASGAINVNNKITAAGSLSFQAAGAVTTNGHGNALSAGDGATISGTSLSLYTVTGGNGVTLTASAGNASFTSASATTGNINLTDTGGIINGTTLAANDDTGFITITGDKGISLVNVSAGYGMSIANKTGAVSLSNLSAGNGGVVVKNTGGDVDLGMVNTTGSGDVTVDSGGAINLNDSVTAGGGLSFSATGAVTTNGHGNPISAGSSVKISGSSLSLYTVSSGSRDSLTATNGDLGATSVTAGNNNIVLTDTKGNINVGSVTATAGSIYVTGNAGKASDQGITLGAFSAADALNITNYGGATTLGGGSAGTIGITTFNAGGDVNFNGVASTTGSGDIIVSASGAININNSVSAGGTLSFNAAGAITTSGHGNPLSAGANATITGASLSLYTVGAGNQVSLTASSGDLTATSATGPNGVDVTDTGGSINVGTINATAGSIYVTGNAGNATDQGITITSFSAGDGLHIANYGGAVNLSGGSAGSIDVKAMNAGGDVNLGSLSTTGAGNFNVTASGGININNNVSAGGGLSFSAVGAVTTNGHGNAVSAGGFASLSGGSLSLHTVSAGTGFSLTANSGDLSANSVSATSGNGFVTDTGGSINLSSLSGAGSIFVTGNAGNAADQGINIGSFSNPGNRLSLVNYGGAVTLGGVSGGSINVTNTAGDVDLNGAVSATSGVSVVASGNINYASTVSAGGGLSFSAAKAISDDNHGGAASALSGTGVSLAAGSGTLQAGNVTASDGSVTITNTGGDISVGNLSATQITSEGQAFAVVTVLAAGGISTGSVTTKAQTGSGSASGYVQFESHSTRSGYATLSNSSLSVTGPISTSAIDNGEEGFAQGGINLYNNNGGITTSGKGITAFARGPGSSFEADILLQANAGTISSGALTVVNGGAITASTCATSTSCSSGDVSVGQLSASSGGLGIVSLDAAGGLSTNGTDITTQQISLTAHNGNFTAGNLTTTLYGIDIADYGGLMKLGNVHSAGSIGLYDSVGGVQTANLQALDNIFITTVGSSTAGGASVSTGTLQATDGPLGTLQIIASGGISIGGSQRAGTSASHIVLTASGGGVVAGDLTALHTGITISAADGATSVGAVTADGPVSITSTNGDITTHDITDNSGNGITVTTTGSGSITVGKLTGAADGSLGSVSLSAAGALTVGSAATPQDIKASLISLSAGNGNLTAGNIQSTGGGNALTIKDTTGKITLLDVTADGNITLTDGTGGIQVGAIQAQQGGASINITATGSGANIALDSVSGGSADSPLSLVNIGAGGTLALKVDKDITAGTITLSAGAGTASFGALKSLNGPLTLSNTGGGLTVASLDSASDITINAQGALDVSGLTSLGNNGEGALTINTGSVQTGEIDNNSALNATGPANDMSITAATGNIVLGQVKTLGTGTTALTLTANSGSITTLDLSLEVLNAHALDGISLGTLTLNSLTPGLAGPSSITSTTGSVTTLGIDSNHALNVTAQTGITLKGAAQVAGTIDLSTAGGAVDTQALSATGDVTVNDDAGAIDIGNIKAGSGNISVTATGSAGNITVGTLSTGSADTALNTVKLIAGGSLSTGSSSTSITAGNITLGAGSGAMSFGALDATNGSLSVVNTGGSLKTGTLTASGKLSLGADGTLQVGAINAGSVNALSSNGKASYQGITSTGTVTLEVDGGDLQQSGNVNAGQFFTTVTTGNETIGNLTVAGDNFHFLLGDHAGQTLDIASLTVDAPGTVTFNYTNANLTLGAVQVGGGFTASLTNGNLQTGAVTTSGGDIDLSATHGTLAFGNLKGGNITLATGQGLNISNKTIDASGSFSLTSGGDTSISGSSIDAGGPASVSSGGKLGISNSGVLASSVTINASGDISISGNSRIGGSSASSGAVRGPQAHASGLTPATKVALTTSGNISIDQSTLSGTQLSLNGAAIQIANGATLSGTQVVLTGTGAVSSGAGTSSIDAGALAVRGSSIDFSSAKLVVGSGTAAFGSDAQLLSRIHAKDPLLALPGSGPNASFAGTNGVKLGQISIAGGYLFIQAPTLQLPTALSGNSNMFVDYLPTNTSAPLQVNLPASLSGITTLVFGGSNQTGNIQIGDGTQSFPLSGNTNLVFATQGSTLYPNTISSNGVVLVLGDTVNSAPPTSPGELPLPPDQYTIDQPPIGILAYSDDQGDINAPGVNDANKGRIDIQTSTQTLSCGIGGTQ